MAVYCEYAWAFQNPVVISLIHYDAILSFCILSIRHLQEEPRMLLVLVSTYRPLYTHMAKVD